MNHVPHLIAADLRRLRWPVMSWMALVAIGAAAGALMPALDMPRSIRALMEMLLGLLGVVSTLLTLVLIALIVQLHAVDSRAFWMARPIPPFGLMASKVAQLIGVLVTWPAIVEMAVALAYGVPVRTVLGIGLTTAFSQVMFVVPAVMVAIATTTVARFFLGLGGLIAVLVMIAMAITAWLLATADGPPLSAVTQTAEDPLAAVAVGLVCLASIGAGLLTAYLTRSRLRPLAAFAAGFAVMFVLGSYWPTVPEAFPQAPWVDTGRPQLLPASDGATTNHLVDRANRENRWRQVRSRLRVGGVERGWSAHVALQQATVETANGVRAESGGGGWAGAPSADDEVNPDSRAAREALGVDRLFEPTGSPKRGETATVMVWRDADYRRIAQHGEVSYRGRFLIFPRRVHLEDRLPLQVGASYERAGFRLWIEYVSYLDGVATVELRSSDAWSPFDGPERPERRFYMVNRVARQALTGSPEPVGSIPFWTHLPIHISRSPVGLSSLRTRLSFPAGQISDDDLKFNERWLANAEIAVVRLEWRRAFERSIEIPHLPLALEITKESESVER